MTHANGRFTGRSLVIAVAIVAALLVLPIPHCLVVVIGCVSCFTPLYSQWAVFRGHPRLAAFGFGFTGVVTNLVSVAAWVAPDVYIETKNRI